MKKYFLNITIFFAVVISIDYVFGKVCDNMLLHAKGGENKQLVDLCRNDHYDMLIMGSSKAHHNYIPRVFTDALSFSCYNAGYDGNGIILAYGILSLMDEDKLPKLIIYDVKQQFDIYSYNGDGDYTRYYQKIKKFYGNAAVDSIIGSIDEQDLIKLRSGLVRYNGDLLNTISNYFKTSGKDGRYGYKPAVGQLEDDIPQEKDYSEDLDVIKMNYFKKFIQFTKEKGIDLIVVFSPEYKTPFSDDFQPIRDLCNLEGVQVIDCFEEQDFQRIEYYKDHCHLNEIGSKVFTEKIVTILSQNNGSKNVE